MCKFITIFRYIIWLNCRSPHHINKLFFTYLNQFLMSWTVHNNSDPREYRILMDSSFFLADMIRPSTILKLLCWYLITPIKGPKMGVSFVFYVLAITLQISLFWSLQVEADPIDNPQPASIEEIGVKVISNRHRKLDTNLEPSPQNGDVKNQEFLVLVDTWWKILAWSAAVLVLSCLCCYFSRCCYLCWDCCSDPFWGCCPQSQGCRRFLLMKGKRF